MAQSDRDLVNIMSCKELNDGVWHFSVATY